MSRFACKLLVLAAVLLMPFGMPAGSAAPAHHEHSGAMPMMQHCPEPDPGLAGKGALADCAMACAAALPAADLPPPDAPPAVRGLLDASVIPALSSIELEIATPPPKFA